MHRIGAGATGAVLHQIDTGRDQAALVDAVPARVIRQDRVG